MKGKSNFAKFFDDTLVFRSNFKGLFYSLQFPVILTTIPVIRFCFLTLLFPTIYFSGFDQSLVPSPSLSSASDWC